MIDFNIFAQLEKELKEYFEDKIVIGAGSKKSKRKKYEFSQFDTVECIDYMSNSIFEMGQKDENGQQKFYINEVDFRREVASKNIDIDIKNFTFIPEEDQAEYGAIFLRKMFRKFAKEQNFGEQINSYVENFPKYGSIVAMEIGKEVVQIPLQKMRIDQSAENLQKAKYVIIENDPMTLSDMEKFKDWDTSGLEGNWDTEYKVYTRWGKVPLNWYKEYNEEKVDKDDEKKSIDVISVIAPDAESKDPDGKLLFCEKVTGDRPFLEAHYAKQHGRWLGIGEVEKNFENQKIRNMVFNLRKRGAAWSTKNIFQTQDDTVVNSLVREVKDGDILKVTTPNGIMRVDTTNRAISDLNSMDTLVTENANQRSFTFEVATGEQLKSNTPFRLGALQNEEANKYFSGRREKLGLFLSRIVTDFIIPDLENSLEDKNTLVVFANDEEFEKLRTQKKKLVKNKKVMDNIRQGNYDMTNEGLDMEVDKELEGKEIDQYTFKKDDIKNLKYTVSVEVTGESIDIPQKMETLTTLYQSMVQVQDPRAENVLKQIMTLANMKLPQKPVQQMPNMQQAQLQGNIPTQMEEGSQAVANVNG